MLMISKRRYEGLYGPRGDVKISPYDSANHDEACYNFRVAAVDLHGHHVASPVITIPKNGFLSLRSLESFEFSARAFGLVGGLPDLIDRGLQLLHPPSVDPLFKGSLVLGLRNLTSNDIDLRIGSRVGKLLLFDVSESFESAKVPETAATRKDATREYVRHVIYRANSDALRELVHAESH